MKKFKKIIAIILTAVLTMSTFSLTSFALTPNLNNYRQIIDELVKKYDLEGKVTVELQGIPEQSLAEFEKDMDERFKIISEIMVELPEEAKENMTECSAITTRGASNDLPKGVLPTDQRCARTKYFNYFRIYCLYFVGVRNGRKVVTGVDLGSVLGSVNLLGALNCFLFEQNRTSYQQRADGTVDVFAIGDWYDNKNMVKVLMCKDYGIHGIFGEEEIK